MIPRAYLLHVWHKSVVKTAFIIRFFTHYRNKIVAKLPLSNNNKLYTNANRYRLRYLLKIWSFSPIWLKPNTTKYNLCGNYALYLLLTLFGVFFKIKIVNRLNHNASLVFSPIKLWTRKSKSYIILLIY